MFVHFFSVSYSAPFLFFSVRRFRSEQNCLRVYFVCYFLPLTHSAPDLHYSGEVRVAATLLHIVPCQSFLETKVNSVLIVPQSWGCGFWRRSNKLRK